jgi:hypothetical protein
MKAVIGEPDPKHVSMSYIERQNLTMRMGMRRFTRLTNGFSKKLENNCQTSYLCYICRQTAAPRGVTPFFPTYILGAGFASDFKVRHYRLVPLPLHPRLLFPTGYAGSTLRGTRIDNWTVLMPA